ncbi:hypothetical protein KIW84_052559 [Lathyrus oleraceus]|uniref:Retroviral polymerase SH3-like domain-containing protein n=1 Tax=Pisum sativum TaxID=3888 RepID=A0A9D4WMZ1_PEA|nr:hypothetical protein KIW84_052559 [Pisum sativum]
MVKISPQDKIEVVDLEEAWTEEETHEEEEEARMTEDRMKEHQINGAKFVRVTLTTRRIVGTRANHNVTIARDSSTFKRIVILPINNMLHLQKEKMMKAVWNETPFEAWSGRTPLVNHLKVYGCVFYAQIPKQNRKKLEESSMSKGYRLYNLKTNKVIISRDVVFDEKAFWNWEEDKMKEKTVPAILLQPNPAAEN